MTGWIRRIVARALLGACIMLSTYPMESLAAEAGARAYANAPTELNVLQVLHVHTERHGSYNLTTDSDVLYYYHYIDLFGKAALIGGYIPQGNARLTIPAAGITISNSGMGDPALVIGIDLLGAPALDRKAFRDYKQDTIVGISLTTTMPLGEYNAANTLNLGANRWSFKPEIAISHAISDFIFEIYGNYYSYTDNRNYKSGLLLKQNGKWGVDSHLSYTFSRGVWASFDYFRSWGGDTTINGVNQYNAVRDSMIGATLRIPLASGFSLQGKYRESLKAMSGAKSRTFRAKLQYVW